mgnify:CR=1 FL=1
MNRFISPGISCAIIVVLLVKYVSLYSAVQRIYQAISDGQLLHPDDDEESDSGDDQGFTPGGLAISNQIRFDSDGQVGFLLMRVCISGWGVIFFLLVYD